MILKTFAFLALFMLAGCGGDEKDDNPPGVCAFVKEQHYGKPTFTTVVNSPDNGESCIVLTLEHFNSPSPSDDSPDNPNEVCLKEEFEDEGNCLQYQKCTETNEAGTKITMEFSTEIKKDGTFVSGMTVTLVGASGTIACVYGFEGRPQG